MNTPFVTSAEEQADTQTVLQMEELTIQVLPEYAYHPEDEQREHLPVLIGYHGTLKNVTKEPQKGKVEIPLPMDNKNFKLGYVADYNQDLSERHEIEYEINEAKQTIAWETSEEIQPEEHYKFVVEFYTSDLVANGDKKELTYTFKKFAEIGMLNLLFLEPLRTEKFVLTPAAESHQQNPYGMNMFFYQLNDLKVNEEKTIQLEYERKEQMMTAEIFEEMHSGLEDNQENKTMSSGVIIAIVGGISVVAIGILLFLLRRKTNKGTGKSKSKNRRDDKHGSEKSDQELKIARLRAMLVDGKISEEEYKELLKKIGG